MTQLKTLIKLIKLNLKIFIVVNTIFLLLIIIFINSIEKKRTIKNNYKLTLNQKENTININGFDITSFKDVTLFNNHKKKKYLWKNKYIY